MSKVLIFDHAPGHGECLSAYIWYFQQLGYEVDVMARDFVLNEKPLCLMDLSNVNVYKLKTEWDNSKHYKEIKSLTDLSQYEYIFIATFQKLAYEVYKKIVRDFPNIKVLLQVHSHLKYFLRECYNNKDLIKNTFCLGIQEDFPQLAPSYFGDIEKKTKNTNKLELVITGLDKIHENAYAKFIKAVEELNEEGYDITVKMCGVRGKGWTVPTSKYFTKLGRISFEELYKLYNESDFLVVLFDKNDKKWERYQLEFLSGRTSGSRQCSVGFQIPLLLQDNYQVSWGLDDSNSVSYKDNEYKEVLKKVYDMKKEQYSKLINGLKKFQKKQLEIGLNNIKEKLKLDLTNKIEIRERIIINADGTRTIIKG